MTRDRFSPRQLLAIELLAQGCYTQEEVAHQVNVTRKTLYKWRQDNDFNKLVLEEARKLLKDALPSLYKVALNNALEGSHSHLKLLLEHMEKIDQLASNHTTGTITFSWKHEYDPEETQLDED